MLHNSSLALWANPSILFVCSLSSHSLDCISCGYEEMSDTPIGITSWSPAKKWNGSKKLRYSGGGRGISSHYLTHSWEDKGVHIFPNGICPKVNVIARLEYELAYYDSAVNRFNHYTTRTPPKTAVKNIIKRPSQLGRQNTLPASL